MRYPIIISAIILFFCSCADNLKSELAVFKATEDALEQSNKTINDATVNLRSQLFQMIRKPLTADLAIIWQPKAHRISEFSSSAIEYINKLRMQLVNEAGYTIDSMPSVFNSYNGNAVKKVLIDLNKGKELYQKLRSYNDSINNIDPEINLYNKHLGMDTYDYLSYKDYSAEVFNQVFFSHVSAAAALSILTKFENDIRNTENKVVNFCYNKSFRSTHGYESFQTIIGQSSNCVKAGDEIEITAGIGSFSRAAAPQFTIDGKASQVDENGVVNYKFKTPLKAGKYYKPVKNGVYKTRWYKRNVY